MKIALASPPYPASIADGLEWVEKLTKEAALQQAEIICFPESYIPGYPGMGADPAERTSQQLEAALNKEKTQMDVDKTLGKEGIDKIERAERLIATAHDYMQSNIDADIKRLESL